MSDQLFPVLMAEDDEVDVMTTQRAWSKHNILNPLHVVPDGEACMDFLERELSNADSSDSRWPGLLLLDINMPRMDGTEVLRNLRASDEPALRRLPVVILTSSQADEDRLRSYDLGANAYIIKPVGFDNFCDAVRTINLFWQLVSKP